MNRLPRWPWLAGAMSVVVVAAALWLRRPAPALVTLADADSALTGLPPLPRRVTVEVLNGSGIAGMARTGTLRLRRAGLDVVAYGGADSAQRAEGVTLILVRRGDTTGAGRILRLYPMAELRDARLESRLVDLTVVLGANAVRRGVP